MIKHNKIDEQVDLKQIIDSYGPLSILLADDSLTQQFTIKAILQNVGMNVDCVNNGEEAIAQVKLSQYDVVLMDIQMPILDGIMATQKIRQQYSYETLPIIALTGESDTDKYPVDTSLLFNAFLHKPIESKVLIKNIISFWIPHQNTSSINLEYTHKVSDDLQLDMSIAELTQHPFFDLSGGVYEWVGESAYIRVLNAFIRTYEPYITKVNSGKIQAFTQTEKQKFLHKLKSAAANIGAINLIKVIKDAEKKNNINIDDINFELTNVISMLKPLEVITKN